MDMKIVLSVMKMINGKKSRRTHTRSILFSFLAKKHDKAKVIVLSRTNNILKSLEKYYAKKYGSTRGIKFLTIHSAKGLKAKFVSFLMIAKLLLVMCLEMRSTSR